MAVKKYRAKKIISKLLFGILVLVIVIPILFPLYFVLISSFKNMAQVYIMPPKLFGFKPILDNYIYIFKTQHYGTYMMNSTIVAGGVNGPVPAFGSAGSLCHSQI